MILQSLVEYYERKKDVLSPYGFEEKQIPFTIVIDSDGRFIQLEENTETNANGKLETRSFRVPKAQVRSGAKAYETANCLWDHYGYVLGQPKLVNPDSAPSDRDIDMANKQHQSFKKRIHILRKDLPDETGISAVAKFVDSSEQVEQVRTAGLWAECLKRKGCNLTFRLANKTHLICQSRAVVDWVGRQPLPEDNVRDGLCLVTGQQGQVARLHDSVSGVNQKPSPLAAINESAYNSFRKDKGFNFPVSVEASFKYATALNDLLRKQSPNKFRILETSYVCWSERRSALEKWMPAFMRSDDTEAGIQAIKGLFSSIHNGAYQQADGKDRFYMLGLAPNSARIMVRNWQVGTVAQFSENIARWFEDIAVDGLEKFDYPPLKKLLRSTALQYKDDNVPPNLPGTVVTAILNNTPLPNSLMQGVIRRIKAEAAQKKRQGTKKPVENVTFERASLIKAYINRLPNSGGEITMSLNLEEKRLGYCLGRLFAVLEKLQQDAQPGINATIKDHYYSSASCSPRSVFGALLRLSNHHLKKLEQDSWRIAAEKRIGEIMELISEFPTHLNLEGQGLFAIGYYHQKQDFYRTKSEQGE